MQAHGHLLLGMNLPCLHCRLKKKGASEAPALWTVWVPCCRVGRVERTGIQYFLKVSLYFAFPLRNVTYFANSGDCLTNLYEVRQDHSVFTTGQPRHREVE